MPVITNPTITNSKQIFHTLSLNIAIYSLEVCNIHRGEAEVNITHREWINCDIQQGRVWNICFIIYLPYVGKKKPVPDNIFPSTKQ